MNINRSLFQKMIIASSILALSGCATMNEGVFLDDKSVKVERIDSKRAKIGFVTIKQMGLSSNIRGKISRHFPARGHIPGHLDVHVIAPDGKILVDETISYSRRSTKAKTAQFSLDVSAPITKGSVVSIKHHIEGRCERCPEEHNHSK